MRRDTYNFTRKRHYKHASAIALSSTPLPVNERAVIAEGLLTKVAERLAVLGQVARLRLVEQLASGSATPQELAETLGLTQQNVSKHLQILHRNGLVTRTPEGSSVIYTLRDESTVRLLDDVVASVSDHLRELSALAVGSADGGVAPARDQAPGRVAGA